MCYLLQCMRQGPCAAGPQSTLRYTSNIGKGISVGMSHFLTAVVHVLAFAALIMPASELAVMRLIGTPFFISLPSFGGSSFKPNASLRSRAAGWCMRQLCWYSACAAGQR